MGACSLLHHLCGIYEMASRQARARVWSRSTQRFPSRGLGYLRWTYKTQRTQPGTRPVTSQRWSGSLQVKDVRRRSAMFKIALPCPTVSPSMREGGVAHAKPSTSNAARRSKLLPVHGLVCGRPGVIRSASTSSRESSNRDARPRYQP